ncbi:unnamed protein product [Clavelina lepadiformis]|uniref:Uncharacterized protein n=1 Tax=Clavelina lepadiformis TaxID=159417 RepID=A0ABP0GLL8_CLALP
MNSIKAAGLTGVENPVVKSEDTKASTEAGRKLLKQAPKQVLLIKFTASGRFPPTVGTAFGLVSLINRQFPGQSTQGPIFMDGRFSRRRLSLDTKETKTHLDP